MSRSIRPFLLLEVLIALVLVTLCALPLLRTHAGLALEQKRRSTLLQEEIEADRLFEKARLMLYEDLPWKSFDRNRVYRGAGFTIRQAERYDKNRRATYRIYEVTVGDRIYHLFAERLKRGERQPNI